MLGIASPGHSRHQYEARNDHQRNYALKFQVITTPDEMIVHAFGTLKNGRNDGALYVKSAVLRQLEAVCFVDSKQYYVHADSVYNSRNFS